MQPFVTLMTELLTQRARVALRDGGAPAGRNGFLGVTPVQISDADMAHFLGLVEECKGAREARAPVDPRQASGLGQC